MKYKTKDIYIGCDPEFVIASSDNFLISPLLIPWLNKKSYLGYENTYTYELRPPPRNNTLHLVAHIRYLLRTFVKYYASMKQLHFRTGHFGLSAPLGGHIHISIKPDYFRPLYGSLVKPRKLITERDTRQYKFISLLEILDKLIYDGIQNITENKQEKLRRLSCGYGHLTSFYIHRRGKKYVLEYRTPMSWLHTPIIAFTFLTLAKLAVFITYNDDIQFDSKKLPSNSKEILKYIAKFIRVNKLTYIQDFSYLEYIINHKFQSFYNGYDTNFIKNWGVL